MPVKLTLDKFIEKSNLNHNFKFDYSLCKYINSSTKVTVTCKKHGHWDVLANDHMNKSYGCPTCGIESRTNKRKLTLEHVVKQAKEKHGDRYDYSNMKSYTNSKQNMIVRCKIHDELFYPTVSNHIGSKESGCPLCANISNGESCAKPIEEFIKESITIHGDAKYDYSTLNYTRVSATASMHCNKHGLFHFSPNRHLNGIECCKLCSTKGSYAEKEIAKYILSIFGEDFTIELNTKPVYNPYTKGHLELDMIFIEAGLAIEYNGHQHYHEDSYYNVKRQTKSSIFDRDEYKRYWCRERSILLIEIPYWEFNMQQPKNIREAYLEELSHEIEELLCAE